MNEHLPFPILAPEEVEKQTGLIDRSAEGYLYHPNTQLKIPTIKINGAKFVYVAVGKASAESQNENAMCAGNFPRIIADPKIVEHEKRGHTDKMDGCCACELGKMKQRKTKRKVTMECDSVADSEKMKHTVGFDTIGPWVRSFSGFVYLIVFTSWAARWMDGIPTRDRTAGEVVRAMRTVQLRNGIPLNYAHDGAREYLAAAVTECMGAAKRKLNVRYKHNRMGRSERGGESAQEGTRTLLIASGAPTTLWPLASNHWFWTKNRVKHSATGQQPHHYKNGFDFDTNKMHIFGATVVYMLPPELVKKTNRSEPRGIEGRFWGVDIDCSAFIVAPKQLKLEFIKSSDLILTRDLKFFDFIVEPSVPYGIENLRDEHEQSDGDGESDNDDEWPEELAHGMIQLPNDESNDETGRKQAFANVESSKSHPSSSNAKPTTKAESKLQAKLKEVDGHAGAFRQASEQEIRNNRAIRGFIFEYEKRDGRDKARAVVDSKKTKQELQTKWQERQVWRF